MTASRRRSGVAAATVLAVAPSVALGVALVMLDARPAAAQATIALGYAVKNNSAAALRCTLAAPAPGGGAAAEARWSAWFTLRPGEDLNRPSAIERLYIFCAAPAVAQVYALGRGERYSWLPVEGGKVRLRRVTP